MSDETQKELDRILKEVLTDMRAKYIEEQILTNMYTDFLDYLRSRIVLPETTTFYPKQHWLSIDISDRERLDIHFYKDSFKCEHLIITYGQDEEEVVAEVAGAPTYYHYNDVARSDVIYYIEKILDMNGMLTYVPIKIPMLTNSEDV